MRKPWQADGLGWVYVATRKLGKALNELVIGKGIAQALIGSAHAVTDVVRRDALDLIALADRFEAQVALAGGEYDKARQLLSGLLERPCTARIRNRIECTFGQLELQQGEAWKARDHLEEALRQSRSVGEEGEAIEMTWDLYWLSEAYLQTGEHVKARSTLEEASGLVALVQDHVTKAFVERGLGRLELASGNFIEANRRLAGSLKLFTQWGLKTEAEETERDLENVQRKMTS